MSANDIHGTDALGAGGGKDPSSSNVTDFLEILRRGKPIRAGRPVELREFDRETETIILAFDPGSTPSPSFELLDGFRAGEKVLTMNGAQMLRIPNARELTLADVNLVEADIS